MSSISLFCFVSVAMSFKWYKYILTGVDVASRYKVARALRTKKESEVAFVLETIYKKVGVFRYPNVFQCDNGSVLKAMWQSAWKHSFDVRRAVIKYKYTHIAFVKAFNKELVKQLFKALNGREF